MSQLQKLDFETHFCLGFVYLGKGMGHMSIAVHLDALYLYRFIPCCSKCLVILLAQAPLQIITLSHSLHTAVLVKCVHILGGTLKLCSLIIGLSQLLINRMIVVILSNHNYLR